MILEGQNDLILKIDDSTFPFVIGNEANGGVLVAMVYQPKIFLILSRYAYAPIFIDYSP